MFFEKERRRTMTHYTYNEFVADVKALVKLTQDYKPDTLIAIARGGLTLGHAYACATDNRQLMSINSILYEGETRGEKCNIFNMPELGCAKKVLLIDDIVDSGQTVKEVLEQLKRRYPEIEFKIASIFYKKSAAVQPDYALREAHEWIEFFWDSDFKAE